MTKQLSETKVRKLVGAALRPLREALMRGVDERDIAPAKVLGYTFRAARHYPLPARPGYAWFPYYSSIEVESFDGRNCGHIGGTVNDCAHVIFSRQRHPESRVSMALNCHAEWEAVNDPPCHPSDAGWNGCPDCRSAA